MGCGNLLGALIVNGGTVDVGNTATGQLTAVASLTVNTGGTLNIDDTTHSASNRVPAAVPINLTGGTLTFTGTTTAATPTTESIGNITLQSGFSTINLNEGTGGVLTINAGALNRSTGAVANVVAGGGGVLNTGDILTFSTAPTLSASNILPYVTTNSNQFASLIGSNLIANTTFATTLAGATSTTNVVLSANDFVPAGGVTVGSLIFLGAGPYTVAGASTLTVGSAGAANIGAVLISGNTAAAPDTISAPVASGSTETILETAAAASTAVYDGVISGSTITVAGGGTTLLNNADINPGLTLDSGILSIGNPTALGTGTLTLVGGTIQAGIATTVSNPVTLSSTLSNVTIGGSTPLTFSGTTTVTGVNNLNVTNTGGTTISGQITGAGSLGLSAANTGVLALTNTNNYSGGTTLSGGSLCSAQTAPWVRAR